jgi:recyclin-1
MLQNCLIQIETVSKVFVPEVKAMTLFINKVFEDSISEYLTAILAASKSREDLYVYLNTLASSIYASIQFVEFVSKNVMNVEISTEVLKIGIKNIYSLYM